MFLLDHPTSRITEAIIGAAIEVHRTIGPGILEFTYHKCLRRELFLRNVPYESDVVFPLDYKGVLLEQGFVIDLLVNKEVIVELKCVTSFFPFMSVS